MSKHTYTLPVREVIKETPDCISILLDVPADLQETFRYTAGQYLTLERPGRKGPVRRAYSLSSAPHEGIWKISVKRQRKGFVSVWLNDKLRAGDTLEVLPPEGRFTLEPNADRRRGYFFVAAGSGITPVIAMIKAILEDEPQSFCHLLYGSREERHIIFREELARLTAHYAGQLVVRHILSQPAGSGGWLSRLRGGTPGAGAWTGPTGRIDAEAVRTLVAESTCPYREQYWYLCGPAGMMNLCTDTLSAMGVPGERVFQEHFDGPAAAPTGGGVAAHLHTRLHGQEVEVDVQAGQTLLDALLAAGLEAPYSCSSGACSSCMARLEEGEVDMPHAPALEKSEIAEGYILTCQARARTPELRIAYP